MAKKIVMGIMGAIIVVFFGLSAYNQFLKPKPEEKPKVDIYKNAMDKVDIEYLSYGESSNQCLLMITNNNKFQIHITKVAMRMEKNQTRFYYRITWKLISIQRKRMTADNH